MSTRPCTAGRHLRRKIVGAVWAAVALAGLPGCQQQFVAPGVYPEPETDFISRRLQMRLPQEKADVAFIFIGGFAEQVLTHFRSVYESTPVLPVPGKQVRACYAWDGARGCLLFHSTSLIREDIEQFLKLNPGADLVLVGHSYGGAAVMDVLRHLKTKPGRVVAVTLDAVSCRERSFPRERAAGVDYWANVYCSPYRHPKDLAAMVGGQWAECPQADVNLCFSGKERDSKDRRYQHARPDSLFTDYNAAAGASAYQLMLDACQRLKIGCHTPCRKK